MISRRDVLRLCLSGALALAGAVSVIVHLEAQQVITTENGAGSDNGFFRVTGAPKFLLFISYFDAMRRSNYGGYNNGDLDTDFAYLKAHGYDGIRIFPNWWKYYCTTSPGTSKADDGLFTQTSSLREAKIDVFLRVLDKAAEHGLLVDVSFTRETLDDFGTTVDDPTITEYQDQMVAVTELLEGDYPHVFFDLQNEFNSHGGLEDAIDEIATAVREADPNRYITVSTGSGYHAAAGIIAYTADLDITAVHPARDTDDWWTDEIEDAVTEARTGMGPPYRPIYLQEPMPFSTVNDCTGSPKDDSTNHHFDAALKAKAEGAAAWTFHTRTTMDLATDSYVEKLDTLLSEEEIVEDLKLGLKTQEWGITPPWVDGTITASTTVIKAIHIMELRGRVDALRERWALSPYGWTDEVLTPGSTTVKAVHIQELRSALNAAYTAAGSGTPTYYESVSSGNTIKKLHIDETRGFVIGLEAVW